jgi:hypothetical protein
MEAVEGLDGIALLRLASGADMAPAHAHLRPAPSMRSTLPLMKAAAGEQEHDAGGRGLASVPKRPSGTVLAHLAQHGAGFGRVVVHAAGGDVARRHRVHAHAALGPFSAAVSVKLTMPARAAPLWPMLGMEPHMSATMLTMAPPCACMDCR